MIRNSPITILNALLFSNTFIALCAMAQGAFTYLLLGVAVNYFIILFLGCSTFCLYNLSLALSKPTDYKSSPYIRIRWFFAHEKLIALLSLISFFALIYLSFQLSIKTVLFLALLALIALSYNIPVLKINKKRFGLRRIPGAKLFLIAAIWALSCVLIPILELKNQGVLISRYDTILLFSKRFLFLLAITLPFDIRDFEEDQKFNLKTIPVLIGKNASLYTCIVLLATYSVLLFFFSPTIGTHVITLAAVVLITVILILNEKFKKNEYYYFLFLDGTLILQFLSIWMVNNLS